MHKLEVFLGKFKKKQRSVSPRAAVISHNTNDICQVAVTLYVLLKKNKSLQHLQLLAQSAFVDCLLYAHIYSAMSVLFAQSAKPNKYMEYLVFFS